MRTWMLPLTLTLPLLLASCSGANPPTSRHGTPAAHFTVADLEKLGCRVNVVPTTKQLEMPILGTVDSYGFTSDAPCASLLISTLQPVEEDDPGLWAGKRAGAGVFAKKHGYDREGYAGEVGDYSEIEVFSRQGVELGFTYNVQANGQLHSVTLISDRIDASGAFESVLREKL